MFSVNEKLLQAAKRIFDYACKAALNNEGYTRYVSGWRKNSNLLIYDIANIMRDALLDEKIHEFMNIIFYPSLVEPAVYICFQGYRKCFKVNLEETCIAVQG
jgi:hypothetical protein